MSSVIDLVKHLDALVKTKPVFCAAEEFNRNPTPGMTIPSIFKPRLYTHAELEGVNNKPWEVN
jgi:hypothetical protein